MNLPLLRENRSHTINSISMLKKRGLLSTRVPL